VDGFCQYHAREIEEDLERASPLQSIEALFAPLINRFRGNPEMQTLVEAGAGAVGDYVRARFQGRPPGVPVGPSPPGSPPRPGAPPRARVPPEAIAARKANIAARGILGFEPDQALTVEAIKKRRQELARLYHPDAAGGQKDATREQMMLGINNAATLLIAAATPRQPG